MAKPQASEFPPYFGRYIAKVEAENVAAAVHRYAEELNRFYTGLPEEKADYRYAPDKWTLKELLQHVIDTERIFSYRVLRISRGDQTPLPSFDENTYAANSKAGDRSFASLKEEFLAVRKATDLLLLSLTEEQFQQQGVASGLPVTANAIGYITFGHLLHHKEVLEERYL